MGKQDEDATAPRFQATVRYDLLGEGAGSATLTSAELFEDLKLSGREGNISVDERAMQFDFELWQKGDLQVLPGMELQASKKVPGFAALTFTATANPNDLPDLQLTSAFMEALLFCCWPETEGENASMVLQDLGGGEATERKVFGSSAGDLVFGYTTQLQVDTWEESLLLNGFLELKNLISWPTTLIRPSEGHNEANKLILPLLPEDGKLTHTRHTIRVLFNQHPLPSESLVLSPNEKVFFNIGQPWQFLAVVEHQLVEVAPVDGWENLNASNDRRWTTLQEVRLVAPQGFLDFLTENRDGFLDYGYLAGDLPTLLEDALDKLPETTLIVEASAPHWVHCEPLSGGRMTTLQFLPNGSQHAILSGLAEASASGADEALAYDALKEAGLQAQWNRVLEMQMRLKAIAFIVAMTVGAAVYDPDFMQKAADWLGLNIVFTRSSMATSSASGSARSGSGPMPSWSGAAPSRQTRCP